MTCLNITRVVNTTDQPIVDIVVGAIQDLLAFLGDKLHESKSE